MSIFSNSRHAFVARLRHSRIRELKSRIIRHLLAGGTSTAIHTGLIVFFVEIIGLAPVASVIAAFCITVVISYSMNYLWVHQARTDHGRTITKYIIVVFISLFLNSAIMHIAVNFYKLHYLYGVIFATAIVPATNFILNYKWAFNKDH